MVWILNHKCYFIVDPNSYSVEIYLITSCKLDKLLCNTKTNITVITTIYLCISAQERMSSTVEFFIEGIFMSSLGLFGIFGNLISIKVLSSTELDMLPTFRHLLKMLAAFDATFLIFTLSLFCISSWSETYNEMVRPWLTPYWLPVIQIALTGSVWTTMAVSVERYLTVCLSYRSNKVRLNKI